jgi:DNA polymerase-3 subunit epsilon
MDFIALDFETANTDMSSICQVGLANFKNGLLQEEWKTYIDPEDFFDEMNISIHGINESTVEGAPTLPDVASRIYNYLDGRIAVCHTPFDRVAIQQACIKYNLRMPTCTWLDSARVTRRTWEQFAWSGYGLANVCTSLGYQFTHHDALEDAKAAAHILLASIEKTGIDLYGWLRRVEQPIDPSKSSYNISREGNPEGFLYGEVLVFTGALVIPRREAADMAAKIGCTVADGVTKNTTILVVGDQDVKKLAGHEKSSKHRKAEVLIQKGQTLRILRESDFKELVNLFIEGAA